MNNEWSFLLATSANSNTERFFPNTVYNDIQTT